MRWVPRRANSTRIAPHHFIDALNGDETAAPYNYAWNSEIPGDAERLGRPALSRGTAGAQGELLPVIARSVSDEAIQPSCCGVTGLLRWRSQ